MLTENPSILWLEGFLKKAKKMNEILNAIVIKVGERYFHNYKNKRLQTAWSLAGAKTFRPSDLDEIAKVEAILKKKNYSSERKLITIKN